MKTYPQLLGKFAAANTEQHVLVAAFNINSFFLFAVQETFRISFECLPARQCRVYSCFPTADPREIQPLPWQHLYLALPTELLKNIYFHYTHAMCWL